MNTLKYLASIIDVDGRMRRMEYAVLSMAVIYFPLFISMALGFICFYFAVENISWTWFGGALFFGFLFFLASIYFMVAQVCLTIKRFHDFNVKGHWVVGLIIAPYALHMISSLDPFGITYWISLLIGAGLTLTAIFFPGNPENNDFGEPQLQPIVKKAWAISAYAAVAMVIIPIFTYLSVGAIIGHNNLTNLTIASIQQTPMAKLAQGIETKYLSHSELAAIQENLPFHHNIEPATHDAILISLSEFADQHNIDLDTLSDSRNTLIELAQQDLPEASLLLGIADFNAKEYTVANTHLEKAYGEGMKEAAFYLGYMTHTGKGRAQSFIEASDFYLEAEGPDGSIMSESVVNSVSALMGAYLEEPQSIETLFENTDISELKDSPEEFNAVLMISLGVTAIVNQVSPSSVSEQQLETLRQGLDSSEQVLLDAIVASIKEGAQWVIETKKQSSF